MKDNLIWHEENRKTVFSCPVFRVEERNCRSPRKEIKTFTVLNTSDWAMVIPEIKTDEGTSFVMVRQWRHGAMDMSLEFPGGVFERGEEAETAAARELREETGYEAGEIIELGSFNPNPAIMTNRIHFFLARDLKPPIKQDLDEDEFVEVEIVPRDEVLKGLGKAPYIHALTGTAAALYQIKNATRG